ncbi:hypothetical protein IGI04_002101, partial [Brassica rapa subsp. trilocularis]
AKGDFRACEQYWNISKRARCFSRSLQGPLCNHGHRGTLSVAVTARSPRRTTGVIEGALWTRVYLFRQSYVFLLRTGKNRNGGVSNKLLREPQLGFYPIFLWIGHISYGCFHIHVDWPHLLWIPSVNYCHTYFPYTLYAFSPMLNLNTTLRVPLLVPRDERITFFEIPSLPHPCTSTYSPAHREKWKWRGEQQASTPYSCGLATSPMGASIFMWIGHISYGYLASGTSKQERRDLVTTTTPHSHHHHHTRTITPSPLGRRPPPPPAARLALGGLTARREEEIQRNVK